MPSPVGHTLSGLILYVIWNKNIRWWLIIWVILCANLPDFDFFIGVALGNLNKIHQMYTHTLGFALIVSLFTFLILRLKGIKGAYSITFLTFLAIFSHVVLDSFNYDSRPPIGVMLFWPFSNHYFNIIPIFYAVPHSQVSDMFSSFFIRAAVREVAILFIPLLVLLWKRLGRV